MALTVQVILGRRRPGSWSRGLAALMPFSECARCGRVIQQFLDTLQCPACSHPIKDNDRGRRGLVQATLGRYL